MDIRILEKYKNIKEYNLVSKTKLFKSERFNVKKRIIIFILCFIIVVLSIVIIVGINYYQYFNQDQNEVYDSEISFPQVLSYEKKWHSIDINTIIKDCALGKSTYTNILQTQIKTLASVSNTSYLNNFGEAKSEDFDLEELRREINKLIAIEDCNLSFIMYDLNTNSGISYNPDWSVPSASAIKLPYVASLLEEDPSFFDKNKDAIFSILKYSDGDSYMNLRYLYGTNNFASWINLLGITNDLLSIEYPEATSSRDILKLWFKSFYALRTSSYADEICSYLVDSSNSAMYFALGNKYVVNSKPGWWDAAEQTSYGTYYPGITCDAGIVYANNNPYLLVIYTDLCQKPEKLESVINKIDKCHLSMFKKDIICNNQEELESVSNEIDEYFAQFEEENQSENEN